MAKIRLVEVVGISVRGAGSGCDEGIEITAPNSPLSLIWNALLCMVSRFLVRKHERYYILFQLFFLIQFHSLFFSVPFLLLYYIITHENLYVD